MITDRTVQILRAVNEAGNVENNSFAVRFLPEDYSIGQLSAFTGYMGRITGANLLTKSVINKGAVGKRRTTKIHYSIAKRGEWVLKMYDGGWKFADGSWSKGDVVLTDHEATLRESLSRIPIQDT